MEDLLRMKRYDFHVVQLILKGLAGEKNEDTFCDFYSAVLEIFSLKDWVFGGGFLMSVGTEGTLRGILGFECTRGVVVNGESLWIHLCRWRLRLCTTYVHKTMCFRVYWRATSECFSCVDAMEGPDKARESEPVDLEDDNSEKIPSAIESREDNLDNVASNLSKKQLKRIKKREKWLSRKAEKRLKERAKAREKRAFARANNIDLGPSRKALKKCTMADSPCKVTVAIDMSFDHLMIDKDVAKLIKQILRCYTLNRRALAPVQFSVTSFSGKSKQEMEKHNGYQHWDVNFYSQSYLELYDSKKVIYLTSESDNVINSLEPDFVYVIGGLVDHNQQKGLCHELAQKAKIAHARLPLDKFLKMKSRKVLTIDHVFEILLRVTEGIAWQESFLQVLPLRKNAEPMSSQDDIPSDTSSTLNPPGSPEKMASQ